MATRRPASCRRSGAQAPITIGASAIAARTITSVYAPPPELINVDPKAGDFNEVHAYCFDFAGKGSAHVVEPKAQRLPLGAVGPDIVLHAGLDVVRDLRHLRPPRLRNARAAAEKSGAPPKNPPAKDVFNHYSDTILEDGRETFDFAGKKMLETVRCDTFDDCAPPGEGVSHDPNHELRPCVPGKFMYFGWEDRPTGDRDYNDIVFKLTCPTGDTVTYGAARLVR